MAAPTSMTGPSGAASNTWTLGGTIGAQTATATVGGTVGEYLTTATLANGTFYNFVTFATPPAP